MERNRVSCWHFHFLAGNVIIADNWLIIHNFNRLTNQRAGKVLRHQKVLRHRVAFLKVLNWNDFLILPLPDFAKGCRLFNSLWGFESHCVTWTVMRTWQIKILCTTCARVRFPFLDFYFPWCRRTGDSARRVQRDVDAFYAPLRSCGKCAFSSRTLNFADFFKVLA